MTFQKSRVENVVYKAMLIYLFRNTLDLRILNSFVEMCNDVIVIVHHNAQWLAKDNGRPDNKIPPSRRVILFHVF